VQERVRRVRIGVTRARGQRDRPARIARGERRRGADGKRLGLPRSECQRARPDACEGGELLRRDLPGDRPGHQRLPLELGRTLLEKGSLERRAKRKTAAKKPSSRHLLVLEPLGAAIWAARARDELGRIGLRRAVVTESLTLAQERVAALAAGGAGDREIAQTLYMSRRTVESHLTTVYRELGIRSRAQLAAARREQRERP
jgi:DNA-binding CsgD family transcriptional regulator